MKTSTPLRGRLGALAEPKNPTTKAETGIPKRRRASIWDSEGLKRAGSTPLGIMQIFSSGMPRSARYSLHSVLTVWM